MENVQNISDISKETLTFLAFFDNEMLKKIPNYVIRGLCEQAADSELDFYIDANKSFKEQQISEKSKDLIALIYYDYIAEDDEKKEIINKWDINEEEYQKIQKEKFNYDNLFANKKENIECVELVVVKKETIFEKIKKLIKLLAMKK